MKLDNLFWDHERLDDPLRIIDWNVTSSVAERGVAGDWARFGALFFLPEQATYWDVGA